MSKKVNDAARHFAKAANKRSSGVVVRNLGKSLRATLTGDKISVSNGTGYASAELNGQRDEQFIRETLRQLSSSEARLLAAEARVQTKDPIFHEIDPKKGTWIRTISDDDLRAVAEAERSKKQKEQKPPSPATNEQLKPFRERWKITKTGDLINQVRSNDPLALIRSLEVLLKNPDVSLPEDVLSTLIANPHFKDALDFIRKHHPEIESRRLDALYDATYAINNRNDEFITGNDQGLDNDVDNNLASNIADNLSIALGKKPIKPFPNEREITGADGETRLYAGKNPLERHSKYSSVYDISAQELLKTQGPVEIQRGFKAELVRNEEPSLGQNSLDLVVKVYNIDENNNDGDVIYEVAQEVGPHKDLSSDLLSAALKEIIQKDMNLGSQPQQMDKV